MLMTNFLSSRKSVRNFKSRDISKNTLEKLSDVFKNINADNNRNISFHLFSDGDKIYSGLNGHAGYNGIMIPAPSYISLSYDDNNSLSVVESLYRAEEIISILESEGLACCWITLKDTKEEVISNVFGYGMQPKLLLAIGYPKARNPFVQEETTERLPVEDIVFSKSLNNPVRLEELEQLNLDDVFYYVRFAPNTLNSQTWRFVINNKHIELYLKKHNERYYFEDAGIIMYYFEQMAKIAGYSSKWDILEKFEEADGYIHIVNLNL